MFIINKDKLFAQL